jgi:hypothetical protein
MSDKEKILFEHAIRIACIGMAMKMANEILKQVDISTKKTSEKGEKDGKRS